MLASYHGHVSLVRLLIRHGADPNTLNDRGQSPLAGAVFKNEEEVIKALLEGVSFESSSHLCSAWVMNPIHGPKADWSRREQTQR